MKKGYERVGVQNAVVAGTRKPERRGREGGEGQVYSELPRIPTLCGTTTVSNVDNNSI